MRLKTWLVAALGLGSLVVLIVVSMLASSSKAQEIYAQIDELNTHHRRVEANLRRLRSDVNLSGIFVRDYLLDVAREHAPDYRERIGEFRRTNMATLAELRTLVGRDEQIVSLQAKLDDYWQTFDPLFDWTTSEKILRSANFLRREVVPRREAALTLTQEIEELNDVNLAAERDEVGRRHAAFRADLYRLMWQTVLIGLVVAVTVVIRLRVLERRSADAELRMRELSQRLVNTQEDERRHLSRELHDHVAQLLTGLRMELGRIERMGTPAGSAVAESKRLVDDMFKTVRNLALGLRPSMLDDFGLQAALEWHVREFTARFAITVELNVEGGLDSLSDTHRTCVYRVIQEAMTNCARHAQARAITIALSATNTSLHVLVHDDGVGVSATDRHKGLGLRGIDERVKELGGTMTIARGNGGGTILDVRLPLSRPSMELAVARVAG